MPQPTQPSAEQSPKGVFFRDNHHLRVSDGDWGLPFVLRLMFARWP